jgi:hypothetical protein
MKEPQRLRDGSGSASLLLRGADLTVPRAARRRALAFTSAAASMAASGTAAAAGGATLAKGVLLWIGLGTLGGGLMSFGVAETVAHIDTVHIEAKRAAEPKPRPAAPSVRARPPVNVEASPVDAPSVPVAPVTPTVPELTVARDARAAQSTAASAPRAPSATTAPAQAPAGTSLFDEQRVIESARAAVARGDATTALSTLDDYQRSYAQGQFGPEALALRVEALSTRGDLAKAGGLAAEFERRYPHHPLLSRVQNAVRR